MTEEQLVEGPAWTGFGLEESAGRYPLRVETAVSRLVDKLLPGVITTTRHARMYCVHALAWADAEERCLDEQAAKEFVRRCEVVIGAVHHFHERHQVDLSSAHGEDRLSRFLDGEHLDVAGAAQLGGLSEAGFGGCIKEYCRVVRLREQLQSDIGDDNRRARKYPHVASEALLGA